MQTEGPRRRDADATRRAILDAAGVLFARLGFGATTVKAVADSAGVSPNLITRYFGGKDGLFIAASSPRIAVDDVYSGDLATFGRRLAAGIVARWSAQTPDDPMLVLHRAAGERPEAAEALAAFLDEHSLAALERYLRDAGADPDEARGRAAAIDALVLGLSTRRRILRARLGDPDELQQWLGEAIQRLATGR